MFGNYIKTLREKKELSQRQLASASIICFRFFWGGLVILPIPCI